MLSELTRKVGNSNFNMTLLPGARARDVKVAAGAGEEPDAVSYELRAYAPLLTRKEVSSDLIYLISGKFVHS